MKLLAKFNPHAVPSQRWSWHLKARNGKTVAASSEGFSTIAKCRKNAALTEDGLWQHLIGKVVQFSNESDLAGMVKKAKASKPEITPGMIVTCGKKSKRFNVERIEGEVAVLTHKGQAFEYIELASNLEPVEPAKTAKGAK